MKLDQLWILGIFFSLTASGSVAQEEMAKKIALDLFYASGQISDQRPELEVVFGLALPIQLDHDKFLIQVDKKAHDHCNKATDPQSAMAAILAPAIVQLYIQNADSSKPIIKGAFLGYMGGYQTLGEEAEKLWTQLYNEYPELSSALKLEARKKQMKNAQKELDQFVPVFQMANYFSVIGHYEYAGIYYEKIKLDFPSREIYSNSGVCKALQALDLFSENELNFIYPLVIDLGFRAGQKGDKAVRDTFLIEAAKDFNEAIRRDPNYAIGYVNLSCVQSLMGDFTAQGAIASAKKAEELAKKQKQERVRGNALIALGIAYATSGDEKKSDEAFAKALDIDDEAVQRLAKINRKESVASGVEKASWEERVGESSIDGVAGEILFNTPKSYVTIPVNDQVSLFVIDEKEYRLIFHKKLPEDKYYFFQTAASDHQGETFHQIKIGSPLKLVTKKYGDPAVVRKFGRGKFYFYKESGIIFSLNEDDQVISWTLFYDQG